MQDEVLALTEISTDAEATTPELPLPLDESLDLKCTSTLPDGRNSPAKQAETKKKPVHLFDRDTRLKMTVLSLSGIHVTASDHHYSSRNQVKMNSAQNFAITAFMVTSKINFIVIIIIFIEFTITNDPIRLNNHEYSK